MLSLEIYKKEPICHINDELYSGMTKVNQSYFFCDPYHCQIIEYDKCFQQHACFKVKRRYTHITYCQSQKCYYAITSDYCNKIFKLNKCFEEEDCFEVKTGCCMLFNGIDCRTKDIYLSSGCYIITVPLDCIDKGEVWIKEEQRLSAVAKSAQYLMTSLSCCHGSTFVVYDNCKLLQLTCCLPCKYCIQDISYDDGYIYILVSKCECYQFVLVCKLQSHCHKPCHQECNDIIESIALMETSLSHILNAEGEKLQKILACSNDPCMILEVNEAVNQTIINVTHLEHVLYSKLETAKSLCEKKKK
ncbi:MAG: hypothetical protein RR630_02900 [Coprobacillus sp.]